MSFDSYFFAQCYSDGDQQMRFAQQGDGLGLSSGSRRGCGKRNNNCSTESCVGFCSFIQEVRANETPRASYSKLLSEASRVESIDMEDDDRQRQARIIHEEVQMLSTLPCFVSCYKIKALFWFF